MTTKTWNTIALIFIAALLILNGTIAAYSWHPPILAGNLVKGQMAELDEICLADPKDETKPWEPGYSRIMKALQDKTEHKYDRLMSDFSTRCVSLTKQGYPMVLGLALDEYEKFEDDTGCLVVWRFLVKVTETKHQIVFSWATCPQLMRS